MATELAKAYVQILPSAQGMKSNLANLLNSEMPDATESGEKLGESLVSGIKKVVAAAGIGKLIKDTFAEGAALEQSVGGVETLFKDSADTVIENANNAYKTAGLSANEYMETVTSFAAALIDSTGRGTQTNISELESALEAEEKAAKRSYEDTYDAAKASWDDQIAAARKAQSAIISELKAKKTEELKLLKQNGDTVQYDKAKETWDNRIAAAQKAKEAIVSQLTDQKTEELKILKRSNEDELEALKNANKDKVAAAQAANRKSTSTADSIADAAKKADKAVIAMSDNANKFGTNMQSVMAAYQGLAKQNYTLLDNLKLGYGGTQEEMARLINDSGVLGNSIKVTADNVKDVPFDKVIDAISIIQDRLDVTGTTAKEAASTFSGSMASMKASAKNLMGALTSGKNVEEASQTFIKTAEKFLGDNFVPMLSRIINSAGKFINEAIIKAPEFLSRLVSELDFESASTLFATLTAPKFASKLLDVFKSDSGVRSDLSSAGRTIGSQVGDSTVGQAEGIGDSFTNKFSKGLSAASSMVSAAIVGWDIGTLIYNMAKPGIDKVTDALVNAFHAEEDVELDNKLKEANAKWRVAELVQKGATWLTSADAGNQYVLDQAEKIIAEANKLGVDPEDFRAAADLTSWNEAVAWFKSKSQTNVQSLTTGARNWGDDLSKNMAQGILDGSSAVSAAAAVVAGNIKSVLGFSEPEEGPLSDFHTYAPDMMQLFAQGIADNKSLVEDEVIGLMSSVRGTMTEPVRADAVLTADGTAAQKVIVMRLVDNYGKVIAEATVDDIDELQGASVLLSERGLAR